MTAVSPSDRAPSVDARVSLRFVSRHHHRGMPALCYPGGNNTVLPIVRELCRPSLSSSVCLVCPPAPLIPFRIAETDASPIGLLTSLVTHALVEVCASLNPLTAHDLGRQRRRDGRRLRRPRQRARPGRAERGAEAYRRGVAGAPRVRGRKGKLQRRARIGRGARWHVRLAHSASQTFAPSPLMRSGASGRRAVRAYDDRSPLHRLRPSRRRHAQHLGRAPRCTHATVRCA